MMTHAQIFLPLLFPCASLPGVETVDAARTLEVPASTPISEALPTAPVRGLSVEYGLDASLDALPPPQEESLHGNRFTVKAGYYDSSEDALDDGYIVNLSWTRYMSKLFALEFEAGYFDADGEDGNLDSEVWGIPLMVNGRLNLPIWVIDLYGGVGIGTLYYDAEATLGNQTAEDDGFLWAGNAFLGGTVNLGDAVALGLEAKYYLTDDISEFDEGLDAYAVMLTLGFSR
jgi:hypothetical protein